MGRPRQGQKELEPLAQGLPGKRRVVHHDSPLISWLSFLLPITGFTDFAPENPVLIGVVNKPGRKALP
jgi:hypothetical protein